MNNSGTIADAISRCIYTAQENKIDFYSLLSFINSLSKIEKDYNKIGNILKTFFIRISRTNLLKNKTTIGKFRELAIKTKKIQERLNKNNYYNRSDINFLSVICIFSGIFYARYLDFLLYEINSCNFDQFIKNIKLK